MTFRPSEYFANVPPDEPTHYTKSGQQVTPPWRKRTGVYLDPLAGTGRPSHLAAQDWSSSWGVLGYHDFPEENGPKPDIRNYVFPSGFGRGWAGRQQKNGVSQLDSSYVVPKRIVYRDKHGKIISGGSAMPYWMASQASVNTPLYNRFGGQAGEVPGPTQTNLWADSQYAGVPQTGGYSGGPGTILSRMKKKYGF